MTIKDIISDLRDDIRDLNEQATEWDEYTAIKDIELAIHNAEKTFERTKNINNNLNGKS